jgi:uncharacterized heparinase superfamily protein
LLVDAGSVPPSEVSTDAHAGTLSFEFDADGERLIVNCGTSRTKGEAWHEAMRLTAAHSTLSVGDLPSSLVVPPGWARNLLGARLVDGPTQVRCRRKETEEGVTLSMSLDGYGQRKLVHERVLQLSHDGLALEGQDTLVPDADVEGTSFAIRFHLHPALRVLRADDGVLLATPGGAVWRFIADGNLEVTESVYLGHANQIRKTWQLVLTTPDHRTSAPVKWSLRRADGEEPVETALN